MTDARTIEQRLPQKSQKAKVSDLGWLCLWDGRQWIAMFQLTDDQKRIWRRWVNA